MSAYVPGWVKKDHTRFPRVEIAKEGKVEVRNCLSLFDQNNNGVKADAKALARFMAHLKEIDGAENTVLMVQVENEVGILGDSRDRSLNAEKAFKSAVPSQLIKVLSEDWANLTPSLRDNFEKFQRSASTSQHEGDWETTFGASKQTDELFMAYHYALFTEQVAAAGKSIYPLPMFTNCWLPMPIAGYGTTDTSDDTSGIEVGGGRDPGDYPSGGPIQSVLDIWQHFAPSLDFLSPDIYGADYNATCRDFRHRNQALFIPEQRRDWHGCLSIWTAIGEYGAIGTCPFAIDTDTEIAENLGKHYKLLSQVGHHLLEARTEGRQIYGFYFDAFLPGEKDPVDPKTVIMGDWRLTIERQIVTGHPASGYGLVIQKSSNVFLLVGEGYQVTYQSTNEASSYSGILSFDEMLVADETNGEMEKLRRLNGDETRNGVSSVMPSTDPDYGDFICCVLIPAETRIALCEVYSLE